jgi:hypothetical protein
LHCDSSGMSSTAVATVVFACTFSGALLGVFLGRKLPPRHLTAETKDVVRLGMGLVGTIAALVLGLLIGSAKTFYDGQSEELARISANTVLLDSLLRHYGGETDEARGVLRAIVGRSLNRIWPKAAARGDLSPRELHAGLLYDKIQTLTPKDDRQRAIQSQALSIVFTLGQARWLVFEQTTAAPSNVLLLVMLLWLTSIFVSWGMYSPFNATTATVFAIAAFSVAGAMLLIQELYSPYGGLLRLSSEPLRLAYEAIGQPA